MFLLPYHIGYMGTEDHHSFHNSFNITQQIYRCKRKFRCIHKNSTVKLRCYWSWRESNPRPKAYSVSFYYHRRFLRFDQKASPFPSHTRKTVNPNALVASSYARGGKAYSVSFPTFITPYPKDVGVLRATLGQLGRQCYSVISVSVYI